MYKLLFLDGISLTNFKKWTENAAEKSPEKLPETGKMLLNFLPVLREDREADVAVAVDVRVHRDVVADEDDLRRVERVLRAELEAQAEPLAVVQRVGRTVQGDSPPAQGSKVKTAPSFRNEEQKLHH